MAAFTRTNPSTLPTRIHKHSWDLTTADHTGDAIALPGAADRSIQISGTWGSATGVLEGSNDGVTYFTLKDPLGNSISFTADGLKAVLENTHYLRPRLSTVGSGAAVTATLISKTSG